MAAPVAACGFVKPPVSARRTGTRTRPVWTRTDSSPCGCRFVRCTRMTPLVFAGVRTATFRSRYWHSREGMSDAGRGYEVESYEPLDLGDLTAHAGWCLHWSPPQPEDWSAEIRPVSCYSSTAPSAMVRSACGRQNRTPRTREFEDKAQRPRRGGSPRDTRRSPWCIREDEATDERVRRRGDGRASARTRRRTSECELSFALYDNIDHGADQRRHPGVVQEPHEEV